MSEDVELMLLSEIKSLEHEVGRLRLIIVAVEAERNMLQCELDAVMLSVDKWFENGDPELEHDVASRAATAREIALQAIEKEAKDKERVKAQREAMIAAARSAIESQYEVYTVTGLDEESFAKMPTNDVTARAVEYTAKTIIAAGKGKNRKD